MGKNSQLTFKVKGNKLLMEVGERVTENLWPFLTATPTMFQMAFSDGQITRGRQEKVDKSCRLTHSHTSEKYISTSH
jgi:hypothetical protein